LPVLDRYPYPGFPFWNPTTANAKVGPITGDSSASALGSLSNNARQNHCSVMVSRSTPRRDGPRGRWKADDWRSPHCSDTKPLALTWCHLILHDITQGLVDAQIVIAEITPVNQNVFYELGFAHALRKPTILLAEKGKQLPCDVSGYRCLFYENSIGGKKAVEDGLRKHLAAILRE